jgi:hypothetical protein
MKISCIDHHDGRPFCNNECNLVWLSLSERVVVDNLLEAPHPSSTPPYKEEIVQSSLFPFLWVDPTSLWVSFRVPYVWVWWMAAVFYRNVHI